jgi:hypothetical protein
LGLVRGTAVDVSGARWEEPVPIVSHVTGDDTHPQLRPALPTEDEPEEEQCQRDDRDADETPQIPREFAHEKAGAEATGEGDERGGPPTPWRT